MLVIYTYITHTKQQNLKPRFLIQLMFTCQPLKFTKSIPSYCIDKKIQVSI